MERFDITGSCEFPAGDRFSGLYILSGEGVLTDTEGAHTIRGGDQFFVPASSDAFAITAGNQPITLFRCFGPEL
jgi:mannose-6-phosphate isomerase class I